jgi:broad specificity phosphatase PhoE
VRIWLVRHGQTEWSRDGRHTSRTDLPLLPEGEEQARAIGALIGAHPFGRVLSSPMLRAMETARLAGFGDRVEPSDLLKEVDYGRHEGRTTEEIRRERPGWEVWRDGCPGGETPAHVAGRADRLLASLDNGGDDVLLFGHAHALRALGVRYVGLDLAVAALIRLDPGSRSILGHEHDHRAIEVWNETCPSA